MDLDLKLDPEPEGVFAAIARIKEELDVNVELASPDDFLPQLADWREQSPLVGQASARSKCATTTCARRRSAELARGFERDVADVVAMLERRASLSVSARSVRRSRRWSHASSGFRASRPAELEHRLAECLCPR